MAVTTLHSFQTPPGRLADHLATTAEAIGHLRRLGIQSMALQPIAGTDVGVITVSSTYADNSAHVSALQSILADEAWQEFSARAAASAAATPVESSVFSDVDPSYQPSSDRPLGVISATQWRAVPGRMMEFMAHVETGSAHIARMGGTPRVMQSLVGAHPMTVIIPIGFADLDAYGEFADKSAADEQFQAFWAEVMMNPTADMIRSVVSINIS